MTSLEISYSTLTALAPGLAVYWLQHGDGSYDAWVGTDRYFAHCSIRGDDIATFEASLKEVENVVGSADDALVLADLDLGNPRDVIRARSIRFGNMPLRSGDWTWFKPLIAQKNLALQYEEDADTYTAYGYDGPEVMVCTIWKGTVPDIIIAEGYSQVQNDADKDDFEDNFKLFANKSIETPVPIVKDGYVTTSGNTSTRILATTYNEQTTNAQRSVVSSSANDTAAGTGARAVRITYYDQTLAGPFTEDVTLNGTGAVNTVASNICFIERMEVLTVGANGSNAGTITLKTTTGGGGSDVGSIAVDDNETNWVHHYIGANKSMKLDSLFATVRGVASGVITVRRSHPTMANSPDITVTPAIRVQPGQQEKQTFSVPVEVTGPARVVMWARSDSASGSLDWNAGIGFYEG